MCMKRPKVPTAAPRMVAAYDNPEAYAEADMEARRRRARAGAAADILTGPTGIPAVRRTMGPGRRGRV